MKDAIFAQPYTELPQYEVSKTLFGETGDVEDNHLLQAARQTLRVQDDLINYPLGQKLINPNGICFAGEWVIDQPSPYSGQFSEGARSLAIVRASVALSGTKQNDKRAFGMGIKLFPTQDAEAAVPTLNAFVLHSLGGEYSDHVLDLPVDNMPALGGLPPFSQWGTALRMKRDLEAADRELSQTDPEIGYRPVSQLAQVEAEGAQSAPALMRLTVAEGTPRIDADDFRDELRLRQYPDERLVWEIDVAPTRGSDKSELAWQRIGKLIFTESVTSAACDTQLHFAHPLLPSQ
ncbi:MAG: hypothetical protein AAGF57_14100 [Pseudomonadota bacterium]